MMPGLATHLDARQNPPTATVRLCILAGAHAGTTIGALALPATIGSDIDCDVVLNDAGIEAIHAKLALSHHSFSLAAVEGTIQAEGIGRLDPWHGCHIDLPMQITMGAAVLLLSRSADDGVKPVPWHALPTHRRTMVLAAIALLTLTATPMVLPAFSRQPMDRGSTAPAVGGTPVQAEEVEPINFIRDQLSRAGLIRITLRHTTAGVEVRGELTDEEHRAWLAIRRKADAMFGSALVVDSHLTSVDSTPPILRIAAVSLGPGPYIVDRSGQRYAVNAALSPGWILASIGEEAMVLRHDGRDYRVAY